MPSNRPNILFAFADDWGRYASAYRQVEGDSTPNALLDTPNFDRVANEGVLLTNAFVPAPSCTPCRSSLLTGRYFWQTERGAILQCAVWDSSIPSYPLLLEESGYHIGYTYKVWSPGTPQDEPYQPVDKVKIMPTCLLSLPSDRTKMEWVQIRTRRRVYGDGKAEVGAAG